MADLLELSSRVEAGENNRALCEEIHVAMCWGAENGNLPRALFGSLDAAKALHEAMLPGWEYLIHNDSTAVGDPLPDAPEWASAGSPAAAWVAAILRAKAGMD